MIIIYIRDNLANNINHMAQLRGLCHGLEKWIAFKGFWTMDHNWSMNERADLKKFKS